MAQRVYLEQGKKTVFAVSFEWPGWCRAGRNADDALANFLDYAPRYSSVVGTDLLGDDIEVVGTVDGDSYTDFGAPRARGPWDEVRVSTKERKRQIAVLNRCWDYFDAVVASAPLELVKGPRGGGRNRDKIADHVYAAQRAYASKVGLRLALRAPWQEHRTSLTAHLLVAKDAEAWPTEFAIRVIAWHVLDHAWEIEDKTP